MSSCTCCEFGAFGRHCQRLSHCLEVGGTLLVVRPRWSSCACRTNIGAHQPWRARVLGRPPCPTRYPMAIFAGCSPRAFSGRDPARRGSPAWQSPNLSQSIHPSNPLPKKKKQVRRLVAQARPERSLSQLASISMRLSLGRQAYSW